jgi:succinoglycan biosynthesis protein ExoO
MQPEVTVTVPVYNRAEFIGRALESVQRQSMDDWEVVVVDNASTDSTLQVARSIASSDSRIKVLANETNLGIAASRNRALANATGRYVTPLDSDDWFDAHRLERLVAAARAHNAEVICDDVQIVVDDDDEPLTTLSAICDEPIGNALEIDMAGVLSRLGFERDGLTIGLTKPMIDRQFLVDHSIHYDASLVVGEDYWFVADCVAAGAKLVVIPDAMYYYRIHSKQTTKTTNPIDDVISGRRRLEALLNSGMADAKASAIGYQQLRRMNELVSYGEFAKTIKSGQFLAAGSQILRKPHVLAEFIHRLPNAIQRRIRAHRGDQYAYDQLVGPHLSSRKRRSAVTTPTTPSRLPNPTR